MDAAVRKMDRLEYSRRRAEHYHHRGRGGRALSHAPRYRRERRDPFGADDAVARSVAGRAVRPGPGIHADGLPFWLGNATVLGMGIAYDPNAASAIDQLPVWVNRVLAVVILLVLAIYVGWVWVAPRQIGRSNWQVTLPGGPLTLLQILIGLI